MPIAMAGASVSQLGLVPKEEDNRSLDTPNLGSEIHKLRERLVAMEKTASFALHNICARSSTSVSFLILYV